MMLPMSQAMASMMVRCWRCLGSWALGKGRRRERSREQRRRQQGNRSLHILLLLFLDGIFRPSELFVAIAVPLRQPRHNVYLRSFSIGKAKAVLELVQLPTFWRILYQITLGGPRRTSFSAG